MTDDTKIDEDTKELGLQEAVEDAVSIALELERDTRCDSYTTAFARRCATRAAGIVVRIITEAYDTKIRSLEARLKTLEERKR